MPRTSRNILIDRNGVVEIKWWHVAHYRNNRTVLHDRLIAAKWLRLRPKMLSAVFALEPRHG